MMKRKNKKSSSLNINISVLMFMFATGANAEKITFKFEGVITSVDEELNRHREGDGHQLARPDNGYAPGDMFSGTYTFETTTLVSSNYSDHEFSGAISAMSFASRKNAVTAVNGGDIMVRKYNWYPLYNAEFSQFSGGRIDDADYIPSNSGPKNDPIFDPDGMTLTWTMVKTATLPISFDETADLPSVPHFHSNLNWNDQNDYTLYAPNYADFNLTYKSVKTGNKALVKGKVFSVKPIPNPVSATTWIPAATPVTLNPVVIDVDFDKQRIVPDIVITPDEVPCPVC